MADWTKCYFTFDKDFEAKQLEVFFQMFEKVLWSLLKFVWNDPQKVRSIAILNVSTCS